MKKLLMTGAVLVTFALSTPAFAESVFDGPYLGLQAGFGKTTMDYDYAPGTSGNAAFSGSEDDTGLNGGLFLGFQKSVNDKFLLGVEAGYSQSGADYSATDGVVSGKIEQNETWELGGRLGYLVQPDTMVYGRLGWVRTNFEATVSDAGGSYKGDENLNGLRIGAGLEKSFKEKISGRLELSYTNYEDITYRDTATAESLKIDTDEILVRAGVAYHF